MEKFTNKHLKIFIAFFLLYYFFNICISCFLFFSHYPENYNWTELFINYQGGLIRRGFIGEILFQLAPFFDIRISTAIIFFIIYISFLFYSLKLFKSSYDIISLLFVIVCPGLLLFFTQDREMLCRKDIFYETWIVLHCLFISYKDTNTTNCLILSVFACFLCLLIHESTIFYTILPFAIVLERAYREKKFMPVFLLLCLFALASGWYIFSFSGTTEQKNLIIASWTPWFSLPAERALQFIGKPLSFQINQVQDFVSYRVVFYFVIAFILTAFPCVYILIVHNIIQRIKKFFTFPGNRIVLFFGFLAPWVLPAIAIDHGRHIHTAIFYFLSFFSSIIILTGGVEHKKINKSLKIFHKKFFWIFIISFAFSWKLWHYAEHGNIVTFSFPIRALLIGWIESLDV